MADNGYIEYCQPTVQKGNMFLADVYVYQACMDIDEPGALLLKVSNDQQQSGSGVTYSDEAGYVDIVSAASVVPEGRLYSGRNIKYSCTVQTDSMAKIYEELDYGLEYQEDPDRPGWEFLILTDQVGKAVKRFSCKVVYTDNGVVFREDQIPAGEIMINGRKSMAIGSLYGITFDIMAQTFNSNGDRVKVSRPK